MYIYIYILYDANGYRLRCLCWPRNDLPVASIPGRPLTLRIRTEATSATNRSDVWTAELVSLHLRIKGLSVAV